MIHQAHAPTLYCSTCIHTHPLDCCFLPTLLELARTCWPSHQHHGNCPSVQRTLSRSWSEQLAAAVSALIGQAQEVSACWSCCWFCSRCQPVDDSLSRHRQQVKQLQSMHRLQCLSSLSSVSLDTKPILICRYTMASSCILLHMHIGT